MNSGAQRHPVELFSTCPPSSAIDRACYRQRVIDIARWTDGFGYRGILVYTDNGLLDPWLLAHIIIQNTSSLCPLVAVQPVYMHPYSVAKVVTSIAHLYGRRVCLNMVAGGFVNDLAALNDTTPHDRRYDRLVEYTAIIKALLATSGPISYEGHFYKVDKLRLTPPLPAELFPGILLSASSEAGLAAARSLGATAVKYPKPATEEEAPEDSGIAVGVRVGVIARSTDAEAWEVAHTRFPEDRRGQVIHQLATKTSDSVWHKDLSLRGASAEERGVYWLGPFQNYKTFCPYLVGSYERVSEVLAQYVALGYTSFILDVPPDYDEVRHIDLAFKHALEVVPS